MGQGRSKTPHPPPADDANLTVDDLKRALRGLHDGYEHITDANLWWHLYEGSQQLAFTPDFRKQPCNHGEYKDQPTTFPTMWKSTEKENPAKQKEGLDAVELAFRGILLGEANRKDETAPFCHVSSSVYVSSSSPPVDPATTAGAATFGCTSLFSYINLAWAKELGVVLSPDLIWTTVLSELALETRRFPESFRQVYAPSSGGAKEELAVMVERPGDFPIEKFSQLLAQKVASPEFHRLITDISSFPSAFPGFQQVAITSLLAAASPYYRYTTYECGIPFLRVLGQRGEWMALLERIGQLKGFLGQMARTFPAYLDRVHARVSDIVTFAFEEQNRSLASVFFGSMYWISSNCESGSPYYCKGWLFELACRVSPCFVCACVF